MSLYEHHREAILPRRAFFRRVGRHGSAALLVVLLSLAGGAVGYRLTEQLPWVDAVYNATMILTGMGPAAALHTPGGKLFASAYAVYSGVLFIGVASLLVAPFLHRLLHRLHVGDD